MMLKFYGEFCWVGPFVLRLSGFLKASPLGANRGVPESTQGCNECGRGRQGVDVHY